MRWMFLMGGFLGFSLVLLGGWIAGREFSSLVRDASIGCLAMALLFGWFWKGVIRAFHEVARAKQDEAEQAEESAAANGESASGAVPVADAAAARRRV